MTSLDWVMVILIVCFIAVGAIITLVDDDIINNKPLRIFIDVMYILLILLGIVLLVMGALKITTLLGGG